MNRIFLTLVFACLTSGQMNGLAHANAGHLGELAGHSHWIGLGAIVIVGAIVAVLAANGRRRDDEESVEEETESAEEAV